MLINEVETIQVVTRQFAERLIAANKVAAIYKHPKNRVAPYTILELDKGTQENNFDDRITVKVEEVW
jgi:hypothetical protein